VIRTTLSVSVLGMKSILEDELRETSNEALNSLLVSNSY
jgi:hypothetical protein